MFYILSILTILWIFLFIGEIYSLYIQNSKPYLSSFLDFSLKEVPSHKKPNELSFLMYRKIGMHSFVSTFFYLIEKKIILVEKKEDTILFTYHKKKEDEKILTPSERYFLSIFFEGIGEKGSVTLSAISSFCQSYSNRTNLLMEYTVWRRVSYEDVEESYFEVKKGYRGVFLTSILGVLLIFFNIVFRTHILFIYALCFPIYFLCFYFKRSYKRTKSANTEYFKWTAYKRYIFSLSTLPKGISYSVLSLLIGLSQIQAKIKVEDKYMIRIEQVLIKMVRDAILKGGRSL